LATTGLEDSAARRRIVSGNRLLPPRSGWELFHASAINSAGQIVGDGNHYATRHAFLMTPSPAAGA